MILRNVKKNIKKIKLEEFMKNKIFLIFIGLILSFNIFANMTSKEKLELAVKYSKEKKFSEVEKLYLDLIKEKNLVAMRYLAYMYS